jgi:hypothetical protein
LEGEAHSDMPRRGEGAQGVSSCCQNGVVGCRCRIHVSLSMRPTASHLAHAAESELALIQRETAVERPWLQADRRACVE